jgi:hypothetical protein
VVSLCKSTEQIDTDLVGSTMKTHLSVGFTLGSPVADALWGWIS